MTFDATATSPHVREHATPALAAVARRCSIYKDQRFSDHAPLTIDYDYSLTATQ